MLILVMLMRFLRKSGFDRRHMTEAALAMRDVMSREEEPSFDRDQGSNICGKRINKLHFLAAYLQWQIVGGVRGGGSLSLVFGQLICIDTRLASSWSKNLLAELLGARMQMKRRWRCHPRNRDDVVDCAIEEVRCNDADLLHASLDGELFWQNRSEAHHASGVILLTCPSHNVLPLAGACLCPLCHCGQVVIRTGIA